MTVEEGHVINIDGSSSSNNHPAATAAQAPAAAAGDVHAISNNMSHTTANTSSSSKYKQVPTSGDRTPSGVGRNALFAASSSDAEDGGDAASTSGGNATPNGDKEDGVSVLSGASGRSKTTSQLEAAAKLPWYRGVTCKDVRDIMPTLLILLGGLLIMIFVIPYAFSSVIKQLEAEEAIEQARKEQRLAELAAKAAAAAASTTTTPAPDVATASPGA